MYTPSNTRSENKDEAFALMDHYPFATLVSVAPSPILSHLPLTPVRTNDEPGFTLIGHMARANPHSRVLANGPVTVAFHGPHAYISPVWYKENDVPTWNYSAVHIVGQVDLVEDYEGLLECLRLLSAHAEGHWPSGWDFYLPDDLKSPTILTKSIVGFKIRAASFTYKKKLGQNRSHADREGVVKGLATRADSQSLGVRDEMLKMLGEPRQHKP